MIDRCGAHPWLGVCLDSAHLYGSGIDVGDAAAVDAMLDELDATIGLDRLKALHINDSQMRARLQPRPPRERRRGADRRAPGGLPRPPAPAGAAGACSRRPATRARARTRTACSELERLWRLGVGS